MKRPRNWCWCFIVFVTLLQLFQAFPVDTQHRQHRLTHDQSDIPSLPHVRFPLGTSSLMMGLDIEAVEESTFVGAGEPRPDLAPEEVPSLLMEALGKNDFPTVDAGLRSMWAFAGPTTRHIFQQNITDFIESAHETADTLPTSFYGSSMKGKSWVMETSLNRVGGESGWIATQVMKTISSDGRMRRWQWELRKHRRPPHLHCWYVESIGSSDRKGQFEVE